MVLLDHMILRVKDTAASAEFYQRVLGFKPEGTAAPFEVLRVNNGFTIDLLAQAPQDPIHLAFSLERDLFEAVHQRLIELGIPYGGSPFDRNRGPASKSFGARGMTDALYFYDPDNHNLEIRTYETPELIR